LFVDLQLEPPTVLVIDDQFTLDHPIENELRAPIDIATHPRRERHPALIRDGNLRDQMERLKYVVSVGLVYPALIALGLITPTRLAIVRISVVERWRSREVELELH
jgi:hypothetical protein